MTGGWSIWIILIVAINIAGSAWLLWWTAQRRPGDPPPDATSHHWDGDLTEYNKPLPMWWINLFWLTIVFSVGYLVWYPGLGNIKGRGNWSSQGEYAADKKAADEKIAQAWAGYVSKPIDVIAQDPKAVATGQRIFANTCAMCHGSDARGAKGYPNLTDQHWQWGSSPNDILATILDGRQANMPPFATALGDPSNVTATAVHVQRLGGMNVDPQLDRIGAGSFSGICAACHGPDGKGNPAIGSADFTDDYWMYGNRVEDIVAAIEQGHNGHMPAHRQILGETRARLVGAYVWSLSHPANGGAAALAASAAR
jgi:cytochrome c oxidase cbb3-type subunit 3